MSREGVSCVVKRCHIRVSVCFMHVCVVKKWSLKSVFRMCVGFASVWQHKWGCRVLLRQKCINKKTQMHNWVTVVVQFLPVWCRREKNLNTMHERMWVCVKWLRHDSIICDTWHIHSCGMCLTRLNAWWRWLNFNLIEPTKHQSTKVELNVNLVETPKF